MLCVLHLFGSQIRPKIMKGFMMNNLKLALYGSIAVLGLMPVSANAEAWIRVPRYNGYQPQYEGMLTQSQKIELRNYSEYEQREPCQNYKILPTKFYRDGCDLYYRYPSLEQTSIKRIVLASYVIEFAFDSSLIERQSEPVLAKIANEINNYRPQDVVVSGYTDSRGATDYNVTLSQQRANAVSMILSSRGVPNRIMESNAFGEANQAVQTQDGVALRANRRVIVEFLK
jgi:OOP family OmpA-OmpF porin